MAFASWANGQLGREAAAADTSKSGLVKKLFGMAPSDLARRALRKQCEHTMNVLVENITKLGPSHPLAPWAGRIGALASAALTALDDRGQAEGAQRRGRRMCGNGRTGSIGCAPGRTVG